MIKSGGAMNNIDARKKLLKDAKQARVWRPYSSKGIAYLLEGKDYWQ
jgi:hypothetical protein